MQVELCCEMRLFLSVLHYTQEDKEKIIIHLWMKGKIVLAISSGMFNFCKGKNIWHVGKELDIDFTPLGNSHCSADSSCDSTKREATIYLKGKKTS